MPRDDVVSGEPSGPSAWLEIRDGETDWKIDAEFLGSNWMCIWNRGCLGIEAEPAPEAQLGCCSVGAEMFDEDEAMRIAALGATLQPDDAQFHSVIAADGVFSDATRKNTRVVDGACIFLNRPDFPGGAGCALHSEALRSDESPIEWKPSVCWELPIRIENGVGPDGRSSVTLRRWLRSDWGSDGETMAWCCTEGERAYVGERPVIESLGDELEALVGVEVLDSIRTSLADGT